MIRRLLLLATALPLAACATDSGGGARPALGAGGDYRPVPGASDAVLGQTQTGLARLFGAPDAVVTEGIGQKLQYRSGICVMDAYLYAPRNGGVPVVTHVDTRQRDGAPMDQASCIAALKRRGGGK